MPSTRECDGCCVKMVHFIGTEHYHIRRTCTDNLEINFFMVNHGRSAKWNLFVYVEVCDVLRTALEVLQLAGFYPNSYQGLSNFKFCE